MIKPQRHREYKGDFAIEVSITLCTLCASAVKRF